jgi:APA family basic amino acid/polyamine antiporter
MAAGIKMPYSWAWDEVFPKKFSEVSDRFGTPHWSLLTLYAVASGLTFWSTGLSQAIAIATFSYLIAYAAVSVTVLYVLLTGSSLAQEAGFTRPLLLGATGVVGAVGAGGLLTQAYQGSLSVYVPWVAVGRDASGRPVERVRPGHQGDQR